jgi:hypothetical protein
MEKLKKQIVMDNEKVLFLTTANDL